MGRPVVNAAWVSSQTRGSGMIPAVRSRAARCVPVSSARQAAMTTSWRSPGTTSSLPSVSTRRPPGTPWANTATSLMRLDRSPALSTFGCSSWTRSRTRSRVSSGRSGTAARSRSPRRSRISPSCATAYGSSGTPLTTQPTTRACSPDQYPVAAIASVSARFSATVAIGSSPGSGVRWVRSSLLVASGAGQLVTRRTSASSARASAWLISIAYSLAGPGVSASTTTTSERSCTGSRTAMICSSAACSPRLASCCSSSAVDSGSGGRSEVMAARSPAERSGLPSARGCATGLTKATLTPCRSRARTSPRPVLARPTPALVGTISRLRTMTFLLARWRVSSAAGDDVDGVASDHQLLVRGGDERHDGAGKTDTPARVPAVVGIGLGVHCQAEEAQSAQDQAADDSAVLTDPASEDQRVEPVQRNDQPCDRLGQPVYEDLQGEQRAFVALRRRLDDRPHVVTHARQALKPAVRVQRVGEVADAQAGTLGHVAEKARIHVAGAGPHHQPLQRGQAHGG